MTLEQAKTLVVGVGEVGSALAEILEHVAPILRHDVRPETYACAIGIMHLCFPCRSRAQFVDTAIGYVERFKPELTIVNSTIVPGTVRAIVDRTGARVAYSPVRGKHARMVQELLYYTKYVAALESETARLAAEHFQAAGMKTKTFDRPETLELAKLAETTYFGVLIAFAQELNRLAERVNGDYSEIIEFFDEVDFLPRTRYYPGFIGGHCVIPNIELLKQIAPMPLFEAVLSSNRSRADELAAEETGSSTPRSRAGVDAQVEQITNHAETRRPSGHQ